MAEPSSSTTSTSAMSTTTTATTTTPTTVDSSADASKARAAPAKAKAKKSKDKGDATAAKRATQPPSAKSKAPKVQQPHRDTLERLLRDAGVPADADSASRYRFVDTHVHLDHIVDTLAAEQHKAYEKLAAAAAAAAAATPSGDRVQPSSSPSLPPVWTIEALERLRTFNFPATFERCVHVCCSATTQQRTLDHIVSLPWAHVAFGFHPHNAKDYNDEHERRLDRELLTHPRCVALGECGLDYFYNNSDATVQRDAFARQMQLAVRHRKPLVVHSRNAESDTVELMLRHLPRDQRVHMHCWDNSASMARRLAAEFPNLKFGFTGALTFKKNDALRELLAPTPTAATDDAAGNDASPAPVPAITLDRVLLETDGPYMAPPPFRGQIAHCGHVVLVAAEIAALLHVDLANVYERCRENTREVYGM